MCNNKASIFLHRRDNSNCFCVELDKACVELDNSFIPCFASTARILANLPRGMLLLVITLVNIIKI